MTPTEAAIAEAVINYLAEQTYQSEPILHAIVCCDHVSRQRMVSALSSVIKPLIADIDEAKAITCVCMNAFKALQMAAENKIDEKTFLGVIESSAIEMGQAADWLKAYTDALINQVNERTSERDNALRYTELLIAQRDRYEKALREIDSITKGQLPITAQIKRIAQEALCE